MLVSRPIIDILQSIQDHTCHGCISSRHMFRATYDIILLHPSREQKCQSLTGIKRGIPLLPETLDQGAT